MQQPFSQVPIYLFCLYSMEYFNWLTMNRKNVLFLAKSQIGEKEKDRYDFMCRRYQETWLTHIAINFVIVFQNTHLHSWPAAAGIGGSATGGEGGLLPLLVAFDAATRRRRAVVRAHTALAAPRKRDLKRPLLLPVVIRTLSIASRTTTTHVALKRTIFSVLKRSTSPLKRNCLYFHV